MNRWSQPLLLVLIICIFGCSYNVREIDTTGLSGPVKQMGKVMVVPDDPVFQFGLVEDALIKAGKYQVLFAEMPGELMNEMLGYTYAWHHGVAYNVVTKQSYPVQAIYAGKSGGFTANIPCRRHLQVFVEGLEVLDPHVHVVIGNARGDKFFDLLGNQVAFEQKNYLAGKWDAVGKVGTSLKDVLAVYDGEDLQAIKERTAYWASTGRYKIPDAGSDQVWYVITPYQSKAGGVDIVKEVARINPNYSMSDKALTAAGGIIVSTDYISTGLSVLIAAVRIPFIEEHKAGVSDFSVMAERLDNEVSDCSVPKIYVPVSQEMAAQMNGGK
jgi:hypothetical protein